MSKRHLIQGSVIRAGYGALALALPDVLVKPIPGIGPEGLDKDARYLNRLFGGRDILVAATTIGKTLSGSEGAALRDNIFCEFTDAVALAQEVKLRGGLDPITGVGVLFNLIGWRLWIKATFSMRAAKKAAKLAAKAGTAAGAAKAAGSSD